ncbi:hypothetical protein HPP92_010973 [Vanilla planifolia]|uniref:BRCT domain-containing protein n=1 Tax=Vanilla planifolia TaxID=51239 RepID=A0A835V0L3_VANPL|nr:hypothetical protein HPP92_010973 [Vanilla planifolia]
MPPTTDHLDTQVLDSPRSADDDKRCCGDLFLAGETLPNEFQETELLYDSGDDDAVGIQDWGKTLSLDDFETAVVQCEDGITGGATEITELHSDGEWRVEEFGLKESSRPKDCNLVDVDVSAGEKEDDGRGGPECSGKSLIDVRVSATQPFGLSAAQSTTFPVIGNNFECHLGEENYNKIYQRKAEDSHIGMRSKFMDIFPSNFSGPNFTSTMKEQIVLNHVVEDIVKHGECCKTDEYETRMTKSTAENACKDSFLYKVEETNIRSDTWDKCLSPFPLHYTSLSYISSQEPGIQSQDDALCVVDKYLSIVDVGLSEDDNNKMADTENSPPATSLKRAQHFARKSDKGSERNLRVYEWIDSLEDEGGGELFRRKKSSFFPSKWSKQKMFNIPSVVKPRNSEMVTNADNKSNIESSNYRSDQKVDCLAWSDSQLKDNHERHCCVLESKRSKKKIFNEMNESTNMEIEFIEKTDASKVNQDTYDIGPATQTAAEAIHALCKGSQVKEQRNLPSNNGNLTRTSSELGKSKITCSKIATIQKKNYRTTSTHSTVACSKRKSCTGRKSKAKRRNSLRKKSTDFTEQMKMMNKSKEKCGVMLLKNRDFVASSVKETVQNRLLVTSNKHSAGNNCNEGSLNVFTSPVAHRTRLSKAAKCSELNEILCFNHCEDKLQYKTVERMDGLVLNASEASKVSKSCRDTGLSGTINTKNGSSVEKIKMTTKSREKCGLILHKKRDFVESAVKETKQNPGPVTSNKKQSASKNYSESTPHVFTSPIAHRTRHSKAAKCLKLNETLCSNPCEDKLQYKTIEMTDGLVLNASEVSKVNKSSHDTILNVTTNTKIGSCVHSDMCYQAGVHVEETTSHESNAYRQPKRQKIEKVGSNNQRCITNVNIPSNSVVTSTEVKTSIQKTKPKIFIRSVADILDAVKQKKRMLSSSNKLNSSGLPSNVGKILKNSGISSSSSLLTTLLKPYFASESHFKHHINNPSSDRITNICLDNLKSADLNCSMPAESVEGEKVLEGSSHDKDQSSILLVDNVEGKTTLEGSLNGTGLTCSPKTTTNTHSPIYNSQGNSRIACTRSLSRSPISRELSRLQTIEASQIWNHKHLRRRKDMFNLKICFSQHLSTDVIKQQQKILARLGAQVVYSSLEATHFVADKFLRTKNMLEAIAMGKLVVTPMWIERCGQANFYIDEKNYILRDAKKEKEIGFNMPFSLAQARQYPLLQGKRVFLTPKIKPNQDLICGLVKATHGQPLKRLLRSILKGDRLPDDLLILSCEEDLSVCIPLLGKGGAAFSSELLLNGIVVQKLEYARHRLFMDYEEHTINNVA